MKKTVKILLHVIAMVMLCFIMSNTVSANDIPASGSCGENVTYTYNSTTKELVISGTGAMKDYGWSDASPFNNSDVKTVVINDGVTSIGGYAFYGCKHLESITIPDSVTLIGYISFASCYNLTNVYAESIESWFNIRIDYGFYSFDYMSHPMSYADNLYFNGVLIKDIVIPNGITAIPSNAFYNCRSLTSVTIPDGVTSIDDRAFYNCENLTSVAIPDSVTNIGDSAFENCESIASITIPDSVTNIGLGAFSYCLGLTSVTIPDGLTRLPWGAFEYCTSLTSITIPNNVTSIGDYAFANCTNIKSVMISDSVTYIADSAYDGCRSLECITVDGNNACYSSDEYGVIFNKNKSTLIQYPMGNTRSFYSIPDSVTVVSPKAFYQCESLVDIDIQGENVEFGSQALVGTGYFYNPYNWNDKGLVLKNYIFEYDSYEIAWLHHYIQNYVIPDYDFTISTKDRDQLAELTECVNEIIAEATTEYDKIFAISKYVAKHVYYDYGYSDGLTSTTNIHPYDVWKEGYSVCDGYARLTKEMLSIAGIPNQYILGDNHAYNMAYDADSHRWIYLDNTWSSSNEYLLSGKIEGSYDPAYFDFPATFLGTSGHEVYSDLTCHINGLSYSLILPQAVGEKWKNIDTWYFSVSDAPEDVENLVIPDSVLSREVRSIDYEAFENNKKLKIVTIPDSVTTIGYFAFSGCENLDYVFYEGTEANKKNMLIEYGNNALNSAIWHYEATEHSYTPVVTLPTCTAKGYTTHACFCGDTYTTDEVAALGHSFTDYVSDKNATCSTDGTKTAKCNRCNMTHTVTDPGTKSHQDTNSDYRCDICSNVIPHICFDQNKDDRCDLCYAEYDALPGDVTSDGKVNIRDVAMLYAHVKGSSALTEDALPSADVTGDGKVNINDVAKLYAHIKGTSPLF